MIQLKKYYYSWGLGYFFEESYERTYVCMRWSRYF